MRTIREQEGEDARFSTPANNLTGPSRPFQPSATAPSFQPSANNDSNRDAGSLTQTGPGWGPPAHPPAGPRAMRPPPGFTGPAYSQQARESYMAPFGEPSRVGFGGEATYVHNPSSDLACFDPAPSFVPDPGGTPGKRRPPGVTYSQQSPDQRSPGGQVGAGSKYAAGWTSSKTWTSDQETMRREFDRIRDRAKHLGFANSPAFPKTAFEYANLKTQTKLADASDMAARIRNLELEKSGKEEAAVHDPRNEVSRKKAAELASPADGLSMVFGQSSAFAAIAPENKGSNGIKQAIRTPEKLQNGKSAMSSLGSTATPQKPMTTPKATPQGAKTTPQGSTAGPQAPEQGDWPTIAAFKAFGEANARAGAPRKLPPPKTTTAFGLFLTSLQQPTRADQREASPPVHIAELPGPMVDLLAHIDEWNEKTGLATQQKPGGG